MLGVSQSSLVNCFRVKRGFLIKPACRGSKGHCDSSKKGAFRAVSLFVFQELLEYTCHCGVPAQEIVEHRLVEDKGNPLPKLTRGYQVDLYQGEKPEVPFGHFFNVIVGVTVGFKVVGGIYKVLVELYPFQLNDRKIEQPDTGQKKSSQS